MHACAKCARTHIHTHPHPRHTHLGKSSGIVRGSLAREDGGVLCHHCHVCAMVPAIERGLYYVVNT